MTRSLTYVLRLLLAAACALPAACTEREPERADEPPRGATERSCDAPGVRDVVVRFGERLKRVSLSAPDSIVVEELREAYAPFVTPGLLDAWVAEPSRAPGREVSSPWPERIEVGSVTTTAPGVCRVEGEVVYLTSVEATRGGAASRERVTLRVRGNGGWRISAYEPAPPTPDPAPEAQAAVDVLRRYYAAIDAGDYRRAYELWADDGAASGQTFAEFEAGFGETARVDVEVGEPGRVEPAAGSRYVEVPVVVRAVTATGEEQRFEGTYTLRRGVVDGASAEQRRWHIYAASIDRLENRR